MLFVCMINQSINLFSIQANNNNIHTFVIMNTERAGKEVLLLMLVSSQIRWLVYFIFFTNHIVINPTYTNKRSNPNQGANRTALSINQSLNTFTNKSNRHCKYNNVNMNLKNEKKVEAEVYTFECLIFVHC